MSPLAATLATLAILFVPGLLLTARLGGEGRRAAQDRPCRRLKLTLGEQIYVSFAGSLLVSGWVGLGLAEWGRFSPGLVGALAVGATAVFALLARKRLSFGLGAFHGSEAAVVVGLLGFSLVAFYPPFEHILGGRDPGIYVNTGFHLARDGNLRFTDPVIASVPAEDRALFFRVDKPIADWDHLRFQGYQLENPESARVVPHGLHLYPTWIGMIAALYEMKAGLYVTPFFAMMGAFGWFFALKRMFDFEVAAWAASMLMVFQVQTWFARFPNSEVVVQFCYAFALLMVCFMVEKRSKVAGALAGVALGSTLLARMETLLFLAPLGLFLGYKRLHRTFGAPELSLVAGFSVLAIHAALHDRFVAWHYVSSVLGRHYWQILWDNLGVVAVIVAVGLVIVDRAGSRLPESVTGFVERERFRLAAAVALFALAAYTYFVRPVWHGPRTAPHDAEALLRMSWYLYPVGVALAISGAMFLLVKAKARQAFFLLTALTFSVFFFYKVRVWHDHYFAMRRFIPVILPSFLACISVFLASLRWERRALTTWGSRVVAAVLLIVYASDGRKLWARGGHEEFPGSIDFMEDLARHIGDDDVVLFPRREGLHMMELPLAELHGKNVLEFYSLKPPRDQLEHLLETWRDEYRDVYFVTNYKISLSGLFTRHVKDFWFATRKYEYGYTGPPRGPEPFHLRFTLSKAVDLEDLSARVAPLPELDVGGSDDLQVAWFHEKELDDEGRSYRWSQRVSSVFLPTARGGRSEVRITAAGAIDAEAPRYPVEVALDGRPLGSFEPTAEFDSYVFTIPEELERRDGRAYGVLTLGTRTWRPSNFVAGAEDVRDLGIRVAGVAVR